MADFSKQYCEIVGMGFEGDFDIYDEWNNLSVGTYLPIICEGFGFNAIGKLSEDPDKVMVHFWDYERNEGSWVDFNHLLLTTAVAS